MEKALDALDGEVGAEITFHPFELNPGMPAGGENGLDHVAAKYAISRDEVRANRERIRERAADLGFAMNVNDDSRAYNTFDAHRLIAWAGEKGRQREMKKALLELYFTNQRDPSDPNALAAAAEAAGLDGGEARDVLSSGRYAEEVRAEETLWRDRGVNSVPAVIVADRYIISGGQPPAEFVRQLRAIAAQLKAA